MWTASDEADEPAAPEPDDGFNDRFDDFMGDRSDDEFEHGPESGGGSRGRILVGGALLVLGLIVAIVAITAAR